MKHLILRLWIVGIAACGGRAEEPGPDVSEVSTPAPSGASAGASAGPGSALPMHDLGTCLPGFEHDKQPQRACNWVDIEGLCFDTQNAACACICPRDRDSLCWTGFPQGVGSATRVHCD